MVFFLLTRHRGERERERRNIDSRGGRGGRHPGLSQHSLWIFTDICSQVYLPSFMMIADVSLHTVIPPPLPSNPIKILHLYSIHRP